MDNKIYYAYMVQCSNESYYTGQTNNLKRRLDEHNGIGVYPGARYTHEHRPVTLQHFETFKTRTEAMRREKEIKKLPKIEKKILAENGNKIGYL